ncbi:MAG: FG-GAP-like repeat-containing protein, partial [Verrucomicrobiota bacterium]
MNGFNGANILSVGADHTSTTYDGRLTGSLNLTKVGTGTLTLAHSANTHANGTEIRDGVVRVNQAGALGSGAITMAGGRLSLGQPMTITNDVVFSSVGDMFLDTNGSNVTFAGTMNGSSGVVWSGSGRLTLTGTNTYTGTTRLEVDTTFSSGAAFGAASNRVHLTDSNTLTANGTFTGHNTLQFDTGSMIDVSNGHTFTVHGLVTGDFIKVGAGTLALAEAGLGSIGDYTVDAGTLLLNNPSGSALGASGLYMGPGTILGGTGRMNGAIFVDDAIVKPGGPVGSLTVGDIDFSGPGTLDIDVAGTTPGSGHDQLRVTNTALLGGTLNLAYTNGFTASVGDSFIVLTAASIIGTFDNVIFPDADPYWDIRYDAGTVTVIMDSDCDQNGAFDTLELNAVGFGNDFESLSQQAFSLNDSAVVTNNRVRLTPASGFRTGSLVFPEHAAGTTHHFRISFDFQILGGNGGEGLSFSFLDAGVHDDTTLFGEDGPLNNALTVSFDTFDNGFPEPPGENFAEIRYNGASVATAIPGFQFDSGLMIHVEITFTNNRLTMVTSDGGAPMTDFNAVLIPSFVPFRGRVAFGARTGGVVNEHTVDNIQFFDTSNPGDQNANGIVDACEAASLVMTNVNRIVSDQTSNYVVRGFSSNLVHITISNAFNGFTATFPAFSDWASPAVPLGPLTNVIHVFGSNRAGLVSSSGNLIRGNVLVVTNTSPVHGAPSVVRSADVTVDFSVEVSNATVHANTYKIWGKQTGFYPGTYTFGSATMNPDADFKPGEEVVAMLNNGVVSTFGSPLQPHQFEFVAAAAGTSSFAFYLTPTPNPENMDSIAFGDLNSDGQLDFFVAGGSSEEAVLNNGGGFIVAQSMSVGGAIEVKLGDLNDDGHLDAFVSGTPSNRIYLGQGDGTFMTNQFLDFAAPNGVELGDVDGDGDIDAVLLSTNNSFVYLNDGIGNFSQGDMIDSGSPMSDAAFGDLNGDGHLDLLATRSILSDLVYLNDGSGGLMSTPQALGNLVPNSHGVELGDLDGDGDLDAIVAHAFGVADRVYLNDGFGAFSTNQLLGSSWSSDVEFGDLDGDGDLDALIVGDNDTIIYVNDGSGTFSTNQTTGLGGTDAALGDVDGDGDL